jgi:hypothetical protein
MEALICSMEALVSSTLAACSEAPWLSAWAVELSCSEADTMFREASSTSVMVAASLSKVVLGGHHAGGISFGQLDLH